LLASQQGTRTLLGPVFSIEIVTSLRRARYIVTRVLYACTLLFALWVAYAGSTAWYTSSTNIRIVAATAQSFFLTMTVMQLVVVLLVGPSIIAGTIAQERQRRTIEYLFSTDLSNREIVLGKLVARLIHLFFIVLVGLPVVAIARMLGGVSADLMVQSFIITLSTIAWVGSVSICASVFATKARDGVTHAYLWLIGMLVLPGLVVLFIELATGFSSGFDYEQLLLAQMYNPFLTFTVLTAGQYSTFPFGPWGAAGGLVVEQAAISVICLLIAVRSVRRVYVRQSSRPSPQDRPSLLPGHRRRRRPLGNRPMLWKEIFLPAIRSRHPRVQRVMVWLSLICLIGLTLWMFLSNLNRPEGYMAFALPVGTILACLGILMLSTRAAASVTTEKEQETWQALVSSPLEGRNIVGSKILGTLYASRVQLFVLLVIWVPCAIHKPEMLFGLAFSFLALVVVGLFAAALGVLISLRSNSSTRALSWTLGTMVFLGGGYMFCCFPLTLGTGGPDETLMAVIMAPCSPFLIVFPMIATWEDVHGPDETLYTGYLLGVLGYGIGAAILYTTASGRFDQFVGRMSRRTGATLVPESEHPLGPIRVPSVPDVAPADTTNGEL